MQPAAKTDWHCREQHCTARAALIGQVFQSAPLDCLLPAVHDDRLLQSCARAVGDVCCAHVQVASPAAAVPERGAPQQGDLAAHGGLLHHQGPEAHEAG